MFEFEHLLTDELVLFGLPLFSGAIALEAWLAHRRGERRYSKADTATSVGLMLVAGVVELLPRQAAILLMVALHEITPLRDVVERQWWAWVLLFFLDDIAFYWWHRASHEIRVLWAGHVNHHSSAYMNLGTGIRAGVGERFTRMGFWLWIPLLGFDVGMMLVMMMLSLFYKFWLHQPRVPKLGRAVELIFNTPSHHRVHHASNPRYLDANHGGMLILWDRLFGTYVEEYESDPCVYGLTRPIDAHSFVSTVTHEYESLWRDLKRAPDWRCRMRYLFLAPGWSHDREDRRVRRGVLPQRVSVFP